MTKHCFASAGEGGVMSTYTFHYINDDGTEVVVRLQGGDHISAPVNAFRQFLLGVTFHADTIAKYINVEQVDADLMERIIE
jgi:hypothetical protein